MRRGIGIGQMDCRWAYRLGRKTGGGQRGWGLGMILSQPMDVKWDTTCCFSHHRQNVCTTTEEWDHAMGHLCSPGTVRGAGGTLGHS